MSSQMCWYQADCIYCVGCIAVWFTSIWQTDLNGRRLFARLFPNEYFKVFRWFFCSDRVFKIWTLLKRVRSIWSCWFWKIVAIHWEEIAILSLLLWMIDGGWWRISSILPQPNSIEIVEIFVFLLNELCWKGFDLFDRVGFERLLQFTEKKSSFYHWFTDGCWRILPSFGRGGIWRKLL